jgi:hypothetical protein
MGELYNQLVSGGPELLDLNGGQRRFFEEQQRGGGKFAADVVYVLRYVQEEIERKACEILAETPYDKGGGLFLIDLADFYVMLRRKNDKPFTEDEFRTLLVWAGHGPAIIHPKWVEIFREAIIEANFTSQPSFTFLERLIEAAE